jgi:hypothetical protein
MKAAGVELIDENVGGPGGTVAKATTKGRLGRYRFLCERFGAGITTLGRNEMDYFGKTNQKYF